jgi:hypothetical protein
LRREKEKERKKTERAECRMEESKIKIPKEEKQIANTPLTKDNHKKKKQKHRSAN